MWVVMGTSGYLLRVGSRAHAQSGGSCFLFVPFYSYFIVGLRFFSHLAEFGYDLSY